MVRNFANNFLQSVSFCLNGNDQCWFDCFRPTPTATFCGVRSWVQSRCESTCPECPSCVSASTTKCFSKAPAAASQSPWNWKMSNFTSTSDSHGEPPIAASFGFQPNILICSFENDRTISFIPPDGEFELMSYRLNTHVRLKLDFQISFYLHV